MTTNLQGITEELNAELLAAGFVPTTYDDQAGVFMAKRTRVEDLPYAREHLVDNDFIFGSSEAVTEVLPSGKVQLYIPDSDYLEGPIDVYSEEGRALLKDALSV